MLFSGKDLTHNAQPCRLIPGGKREIGRKDDPVVDHCYLLWLEAGVAYTSRYKMRDAYDAIEPSIDHFHDGGSTDVAQVIVFVEDILQFGQYERADQQKLRVGINCRIGAEFPRKPPQLQCCSRQIAKRIQCPKRSRSIK